MQHRLWRTFGALAIANIVLVFAALAVQKMTPELGSSRQDVAQNYLQKLMGTAAKATEALPLLPSLLHPDRWLLWLGVLFVLSVYFFPSGIVGKLRARARD